MEYQVLTKSLRFSQLENELQFKITPTPGVFRNKYVQDDYASSGEYGMMTHDDDNALVHAFMILDRIRRKNNPSHNHRYCGQLVDDLQNLLLCYNFGFRVRREETQTIISSMLAVKGCARPLAGNILSYYENYYKSMTEESDYYTKYFALNFTDLYIRAADKAPFLDQDIDLAIQFYHLAGLWWGDPSSFTVKSPVGKWQLMERRFIDILNNGGKNIRSDKSPFGDVLIPLTKVVKALEAGNDNVRIIELANEGFSAYGQTLKKAGDNLQLLRELVITVWALKKFSLLPAPCCLKDEQPETVRTLTDNAKAAILAIRLPDAPTYPLRRYLRFKPVQNVGIQHLIADRVHRALFVHHLIVLSACITARTVSVALPPEPHGPSTISTFEQARKYLCGPVLLFSAAVGDLLLYLIEYITRNDRLMGILNTNPLRRRGPGQLFVFKGHDGQPVVNDVPNVIFILQYLFAGLPRMHLVEDIQKWGQLTNLIRQAQPSACLLCFGNPRIAWLSW